MSLKERIAREISIMDNSSGALTETWEYLHALQRKGYLMGAEHLMKIFREAGWQSPEETAVLFKAEVVGHYEPAQLEGLTDEEIKAMIVELYPCFDEYNELHLTELERNISQATLAKNSQLYRRVE